MDENANKFLEDMAEDFFAESDELLSLIRKNLLLCETLKGSKIPAANVLEELLRSFHTLKGLAGMVGAEDLVNLTHQLENYIKFVFESRQSIDSRSLDVLFSGVTTIEKLLSAIRDKSPAPDISDIISSIKNISGENYSVPEKTSEEETISDNETLWRFSFTPSRELFEKGININNVRMLISSIGKVTGALPRTDQENRITFEFTVLTTEPEESFRNKLPDGVLYKKVEVKPPVVEPGSGSYHKQIQKNIVRVDLTMIDEIINTIGDLVTTRSRLGDQIINMEPESRGGEFSGLLETTSVLERQLRILRDGVMKLRLIPVGEAFERLRFAARDIIRESGKQIRIELKGQDTHIDKFIMEKMFDPLLHLVRNAVSHGIEPGPERSGKGKPVEGNLTLNAFTSGNAVIFEVSDDGAGIDREKVREKAIKSGIINPDGIIDDQALLNILCSSGFSTRENTDTVSGRGVGMNVVKQCVQELGGNMYVHTTSDQGTTFRIQLPLTLSIVDALIVETGSAKFAVPLPVVDEVISINKENLVKIGESEIVHYRGSVLPLFNLNRYFNLPESSKQIFNALVVGSENDKAGIIIERILGQREIVVRSLSDPLLKINGIAGATEIGEGTIILILDAQELVRTIYVNQHKQVGYA
jgi:two-component system chemotaxis sensor kinase CheA